MSLTAEQQALLENPLNTKTFMTGKAGTGKTTAGTLWLKKLLASDIPAHEILVFVPQRALAKPYEEAVRHEKDQAHSLITTMTIGGLARRMVDIFWPIISEKIGVQKPDHPPKFLTLETAQYYMAHVVRPLIERESYFTSLTINRNRIYSQILDNLNKSAIVGFDHQEIGDRLKAAWVGDLEQLHIYDNVQDCATRFRQFCLENNLLDFSLQLEVFSKHLWHLPLCQDHLMKTHRHLIADNIEEDTPITHDIFKAWLPALDSALLIFDEDAGYRYFLGADVGSAASLRDFCQKTTKFTQPVVENEGVIQLQGGIYNAIARLSGQHETHPEPDRENLRPVLVSSEIKPKYFPGMVQWVTEQIVNLVDQGVSPGQIVVLAPFMPDVLRFSLSNQLNKHQIPNHAHRPSRSLSEEPATQSLLTLAKVAFPAWGMSPKRINLACALMQVIGGLDLVRSQLLTAYAYEERAQHFPLKPFEAIPVSIRDRITYRVGSKYDRLQSWLADVNTDEALDFFFNRLFGEVLSQPGFGFHEDLDSGNTIASLIESVQKFRWTVGEQIPSGDFPISREYIQMVEDGVIAAQHVQTWQQEPEDSVFIAPAYTFLIRNRPVDYQFWLEIGSPNWYQRLNQPLTHPYVLSRTWDAGEVWDTADELQAAYVTLKRLSVGLLNRCRQKVYIGMSELDVRGYENRGLLARIFNDVWRRASQDGHK